MKNEHAGGRNNNIKKRNDLQRKEPAKQQGKIKKRDKQKKSKSGAIVLIALMIIAVLFLLGPMAFKSVTGKISTTETLKSGTIEDSFNTNAIIIRSEEVYTSAISGTCIPIYKEGEQVPKGVAVASVINSASQDMVAQKKLLNDQIRQIRDYSLNGEGFVSQEIKNIDDKIKNNINNFSNMYYTGDLTGYQDAYGQIKSLLLEKSGLNGVGSGSAYLQSLETQQKNLDAALKNNMKDIVSNTPGTVSYSVDGFESLYTPTYIKNLNTAVWNGMFNSIKAGNQKKPDNAYAKIITDFNYYLICNVKSSGINGLKTGDSVDVRINDKNLIINMTVGNITPDGTNSVLTLNSDKGLSEMTVSRVTNIDVILKKVNGIKVPLKAITNENFMEQTGEIALIDSGHIKHVTVKMLLKKDGYAIIDNLTPESGSGPGFNYGDIISIGD